MQIVKIFTMKKWQFKILDVLSPICVADIKVTSGYNFFILNRKIK